MVPIAFVNRLGRWNDGLMNELLAKRDVCKWMCWWKCNDGDEAASVPCALGYAVDCINNRSAIPLR